MKLVLLAVLWIPALVCAADYVGNAKGVAMMSALQRENFQLVAGKLGSCQKSGTQVIYRDCSVTDGSITLHNANGDSQTLVIEKVLVSDSTTRHITLRDYIFSGRWKDANTGINDIFSLELHERINFPGRIWGNLAFHGYRIVYGIEARLE